MLSLACALLLAAAPAKPASTTPSTTTAPATEGAEARLERAVGEYRALRFDKAVDVLEDLLFDGALSDQSRARALVLLGVSYAQLGEAAVARERMVEGYVLDPDVAPAVPIPKKVKKLMEGAKKSALARRAAAPPPPPPTTTTTTPSTTPTSTPTPETPTTTTAAPPSSPSLLPWVITGVGGVSVVGAAVAGGLGFVFAQQSADPQSTQRAAVDAANNANVAIGAAAAAGVVGVVLVGVGVVLAAGD